MSDETAAQVVRHAAARRTVEDWALVLVAVGIDARIDWSPVHGYLLLVAPADTTAARAALDAYEAENRARPAAAPPPAYGTTAAVLGITAALCLVFVYTGPRAEAHAWFAAGAADARQLRAGEWWRAITALTLHADFPHIFSNAVALLLFGTALATLVGPGSTAWLLLLAGTGGNLLNTVVRGTPHSAVGASTAIFGALGALAAVRVVQRRQGAAVASWRAWAPLAAALALLGLLGSSARSDVLAHLFGFLVGALLGAVLAVFRPIPVPPAAQHALLAAAALVVATAWWLALR